MIVVGVLLLAAGLFFWRVRLVRSRQAVTFTAAAGKRVGHRGRRNTL